MIFGGQFGFGIGQNWQSVTRLPSTLYTNSTGKTIFLRYQFQCNTAVLLANGQLTIINQTGGDNNTILKAWAVGEIINLDLFVLNGKQYQISTIPAGVALIGANELR